MLNGVEGCPENPKESLLRLFKVFSGFASHDSDLARLEQNQDISFWFLKYLTRIISQNNYCANKYSTQLEWQKLQYT